MNKWHGILVTGLLLLSAACQTSNKNSPYPQISVIAFSPDTVRSGNGADTAFLALHFSDGDGDLNQFGTIRVVDKRANDTVIYAFPDVPNEVVDPANGISGTLNLFFSGQDVIIRTDTVHTGKGDTTQFAVQVIDQAGNASNIATTPKLYIKP